jgi:hypothetical protein
MALDCSEDHSKKARALSQRVLAEFLHGHLDMALMRVKKAEVELPQEIKYRQSLVKDVKSILSVARQLGTHIDDLRVLTELRMRTDEIELALTAYLDPPKLSVQQYLILTEQAGY